jgi:hypothetical protein
VRKREKMEFVPVQKEASKRIRRRGIAAIAAAAALGTLAAAAGAASSGSDASSDSYVGFVLDRGRIERIDLLRSGTVGVPTLKPRSGRRRGELRGRRA